MRRLPGIEWKEKGMRSRERSRAAFPVLAGAAGLALAAMSACGDPGAEPAEDQLEEAPDAAPAAGMETRMEIVEYETLSREAK